MSKRYKNFICRMDGCTHEADGSCGLCKPCYAWLRYWSGASPKKIMDRMDALNRAERRMSTIAPVRSVSSAKRKRA